MYGPRAVATPVSGDLKWWAEILRLANEVYAGMPQAVRDEIELGASDRELARMATHLAALSTPTRQRIAEVLIELGDKVNVNLRPACGLGLRAVEDDAD